MIEAGTSAARKTKSGKKEVVMKESNSLTTTVDAPSSGTWKSQALAPSYCGGCRNLSI
jgi:hypothetical protein